MRSKPKVIYVGSKFLRFNVTRTGYTFSGARNAPSSKFFLQQLFFYKIGAARCGSRDAARRTLGPGELCQCCKMGCKKNKGTTRARQMFVSKSDFNM